MNGKKILLFAGTTEGRKLASFFERKGISCHICTATAYGEELIEQDTTCHQVHAGRMDAAQMAEAMSAWQIADVIDATHPYAVEASVNIREASCKAGCRYIRLLREKSPIQAYGEDRSGSGEELPGDIKWVSSVSEAAAYLRCLDGNILVTTGSRELACYTEIPDYRSRVFARVLPSAEAVAQAGRLGFAGRNLICMQGPFSEELNRAMLRSIDAKFLVTKESGKEGGFAEKVRAAREAGAQLVVVRRPAEENGYLLEQVEQMYAAQTGMTAETLAQAEKMPETAERIISLVGIGMGSPMNLTREAWQACLDADILIGASRMLETMKELGKPECCAYQAEKIAAFLQEHPQYRRAAVLFSGDTGFYSGASKLLQLLREDEENFHAGVHDRENVSGGTYDKKTVSGGTHDRENVSGGSDDEGLADGNSAGRKQWELRVFNGISTVQYLCGKLCTPWEDVKLISLHGRSQNLVDAVRRNRKVFVLTGKREEFCDMCRQLETYGLEEVTLRAGMRLSYPDEQIRSGRPADFLKESGSPAHDLTAVLIENPEAVSCVQTGIPDDLFIRTQVPMTKSEVRAVSVSRMRLASDSIVFDIGAGTGSVSVEAAGCAPDGHVYAVEKNPEAAELIRGNARRFGRTNLTVVEGFAPDALEGLPVPTHAFLGGTSGEMRRILEKLLMMNPAVRVVINVITLESLAEALKSIRELGFHEEETVCVSVSRARQAGSFHMMTGQNPVYIITCRGAADEPC